MTRRLAGGTASCLALLAGLWIVLAPFALGTQKSGADWTDETITDVATGLGLAALGLIGIIAFVAAIRQHLVERGNIAPRHRQRRVERPAAAPAGDAPSAQQGAESELSAVLAPLVAALTRDVTREQQAANGTATPTAGAHYADRPEMDSREQR